MSKSSTEFEEDEKDGVFPKSLLDKLKNKNVKCTWASSPSADSDSTEFDDEDEDEDVAASVAKSAVSSEDENG